MGEHCNNTGHSIPPANVKVLDREEVWYKGKVKEAIHSKQRQQSLNRDCGLELSAIYNHIVSHGASTPSHMAE